MSSNKTLLTFILLLSFNWSINAQLILNEVSQGTTGSEEYIELVVVGDNNGCNLGCADIRGWVLDDNNGWFSGEFCGTEPNGNCSSAGIAGGAIRFDSIPKWECVPIGTMIVVYNEADVNPLIPADDPNDSNGDCVIVLPGNSPLFVADAGDPNSSDFFTDYSDLTWSDTPSWSDVSMSNSDDSYQLISPDNYTTTYHAVSWGNNEDAADTILYFNGSVGGEILIFSNIISNDPFDWQNWENISASGNETPGAANNPANQAWLDTLRNGCDTLIADAGPDQEFCPEDFPITTTFTATSVNGDSYEWSTTDMTAMTGNVMASDSTSYFVTVTSSYGCTAVDTVSVLVADSPTVEIMGDTLLCNGASLTLDAGSPYNTYNWSTTDMTQTTMVSATGVYTVTVTDVNNCEAIDSVTITDVPIFFLK